MKPILFFLCLFALLTLGLTCCQAADTSAPPLVVDWTLDAATAPVILAACPGGQCAAPRSAVFEARPLRRAAVTLAAARPLQRAAGVMRAVRPLQRAAGLIQSRPLKRVGSAIREARPVRKVALLGAAPVRWLARR